MNASLTQSARNLTGLAHATASLYRGRHEALCQVVLDTYFSTTLVEGKSHFVFMGHFLHIPYREYLEEAYCSLRRYDLTEVKEYADEIFGPRTALIVIGTADPYTAEPIDPLPLLEEAQKRSIAVHLEISHSIGLHSSFVEEASIASLSFMTEAIGGDIGSLLLRQKAESKADPADVGEAFLEDICKKMDRLKEGFQERLLSLAKQKRRLSKCIAAAFPERQELVSLSSTLALALPHVDGEALVFRLAAQGKKIRYHPEYPAKIAIPLDLSLEASRLEKKGEIEELVALMQQEAQILQKMAGKL